MTIGFILGLETGAAFMNEAQSAKAVNGFTKPRGFF
jgi:hypothetical protein